MEYAGIYDAQQGFSFVHVVPDYAVNHGFTERCAFKNYRCQSHGIYFQLDLHKK